MKAIDLENQKFGYLTAQICVRKNKKRYYKCLCVCGKEIERTVSQLRAGGDYQSCGCKFNEHVLESTNLLAETFGDLVVVQRIGPHAKSKSVLWKCQCKCCGQFCEKTSKSLLRKNRIGSQNCGCKVYHAKLSGKYGILNRLISSYKSNAKRKGRDFYLTNEECLDLFAKKCFYCGKEPLQLLKHKSYKDTYLYNGIDRLDNDKSYIRYNCVSCCSDCNYIKSSMSAGKFLEWVERVYQNRIISNHRCNLCHLLLKQNSFIGDYRVLSCANCTINSETRFQLELDYDNEWEMGYCIVDNNMKSYKLVAYNSDIPFAELFEIDPSTLQVKNLVRKDKEKSIGPHSLCENRVKTILNFG